jgi:hypothetical protein
VSIWARCANSLVLAEGASPRRQDGTHWGRGTQMLKTDPAEILRFLNLLKEPDQIIELRLLSVKPPGKQFSYTLSGYFNDYKKLAESVLESGSRATQSRTRMRAHDER